MAWMSFDADAMCQLAQEAVNQLCSEVTLAIQNAEREPSAKNWHEVYLLESQLANAIVEDTVEWHVAKRSAILAASKRDLLVLIDSRRNELLAFIELGESIQKFVAAGGRHCGGCDEYDGCEDDRECKGL